MRLSLLKFSRIEIRDLLKSLFAIGLAFAIAQSGLSFGPSFIIILIISLITVGTGFIFHELAHKYFAQKYGCFSEFRSDDKMLVFAVLISFTGFIFVAPGAVYINGHLTKKQNGIVSVAGPAVNFLLAFVFLLVYAVSLSDIFLIIGKMGFMINTWLGLFNLIPIMPFDGKKVFLWNKMVYFLMAGFGLLMLLFSASL